MKTLFAIAIAGLLALSASAQTESTNPPASILASMPAGLQTALTVLEANTNALTATNWTGFTALSKVSGAASKWGGTFGVVYYQNPYIGYQIRMQYINTGASKWFLPNGAITLQSVYQPIHSLPIYLRPMVEAGAAVDFSGNMYAIVGAGSELDLWVSSNPKTAVQRISAFYGTEQWRGMNRKLSVQQFGGAVNLQLGPVIQNVKTWVTALISKI